MKLAERLSILSPLPSAAWVFDPIHYKMHWGNHAALEVWNSPSHEAFLKKDLSDISEATRVQIASWLELCERGQQIETDWIIYPDGVAMSTRMNVSGVPLDDGRMGLLFLCALKERAPDPNLVRSTEAMRHTRLVVAIIAENGEILLRNPAAIRAFGPERPLSDWFDDANVAAGMLEALHSGEVYEIEASSRTSGEPRWYVVEGRPVADPVTGKRALLVHMVDDTARRGAENRAEAKGRLVEELRQTLELVEAQRREILELSAPILRIGRGALAVPIIGAIDRARFKELVERLLPIVAVHGASSVVLDLTGAGSLEAEGVDELTRLVRALGLCGAKTVLTGIGPTLARLLVEARSELEGATILRSLAEGIDACRTARSR